MNTLNVKTDRNTELGLEPASILLVDDRSENLLAMEAILEPLHQHIVKATSGTEALKALLQQDFAAVLLDVQMPGMDGFELAAMLRQRPRSKHIPIIFVTAIHNSEPYISKGYQVGAVDYLFKPFSPEVLMSKVKVFVELFQMQQRLRAAERREYEGRLQHAHRLHEAQLLKQILRELEFARNIQRSILPTTFAMAGTRVHADIRAASEVGGDFYDVISSVSGDPTVSCIIGDVMGKGMPAAMTMVLALTVLRELHRIHPDPRDLFAAANNRIFHQLHQADVANNVSAAMVTLNMRTFEARYCKAGHEDVLHWSATRQGVETLPAVGFFLGTFEEGQYDEYVFRVEKGDKIILYTDGITEARDARGELFGVERLRGLIQGHGNESADDLGDLITEEVSAFQRGREQADDIALVIVEIL